LRDKPDVSDDAALILAALGRMDEKVRGERAALDRLRLSLRDMAQTIARAKAVADSETAATLLDEFEHRIDASRVAGRVFPLRTLRTPPRLAPACRCSAQGAAEDRPMTHPARQAGTGRSSVPPFPASFRVQCRRGPPPYARRGRSSRSRHDRRADRERVTPMVQALSASMPRQV
jgi:hypothetical protein